MRCLAVTLCCVSVWLGRFLLSGADRLASGTSPVRCHFWHFGCSQFSPLTPLRPCGLAYLLQTVRRLKSACMALPVCHHDSAQLQCSGCWG